MFSDLRFNELAVPRIDAIQIAGAVRTLASITARNLEKATPGGEPRQLKDRKEKMRRRLADWNDDITFERATQEVGRERILLSLYLEYTGRSDATWLPKFEEPIASSVLGTNGQSWHAGRRRQAAQLFFTHFDQLPPSGLSHLCRLLVDAFVLVETGGNESTGKWQRNRTLLFSPLGHWTVAGAAGTNETMPLLMERFGIPTNGRFAECLRQVYLLAALRGCPLGQEIPALAEIEALKRERASASQVLGAAALQIMVQRVAKEGGRKWSGEWPKWILRLGSDPRYGRATLEGAKWWGWATDDELRLAQQGITGVTLRFFIEFLRQSLEGATGQSQFKRRAKFLLGLDAAQKINDARVIVSAPIYVRIQQEFRDAGSVARFQDGGQEAKAVICLSCADDVFVIEGTHNFALRAFHKWFPLGDFWSHPQHVYERSKLVVPQADCPIYLTHGQRGGWVADFFSQLRTRFHIEWDDVRL
jgi:hypothetical protein